MDVFQGYQCCGIRAKPMNNSPVLLDGEGKNAYHIIEELK